MQNNVIYGAFGQTRTVSAAPENASLARFDEITPTAMSARLTAQRRVLSDLAELINEPGLPQEIALPLKKELADLQETAVGLASKIVQAHTNDQVFLEIQGEVSNFGTRLIEFEGIVLHKTGAEIELVEPPPPPALTQMRAAIGTPSKWVNSPKFWIGASVGVAALGGLLWWAVQKEKPAPKEDFSKSVTRVKLRRAMPAR